MKSESTQHRSKSARKFGRIKTPSEIFSAPPSEKDLPENNFPKTDTRYWRQRLLLRRYRFPASGESEQDLAAQIDHAGIGFFFPLGTPDVETAAAKAGQIYQAVVKQGWSAACRHFSRELIVSFEWCMNPVLWTYTTIHTMVGGKKSPNPIRHRAIPTGSMSWWWNWTQASARHCAGALISKPDS